MSSFTFQLWQDSRTTAYQSISQASPLWRQMKWNEVAQSCPTLCEPMDRSPPGSSVHGIFQARILGWVAISFSRGSSRLRDRTQVSLIAGRHFNLWATSRRTWREMHLPSLNNIHTLGFPGGSRGKESASSAGDMGFISGWGRSPAEVNGYPFQYSCLEKPMEKAAWRATVQPSTYHLTLEWSGGYNSFSYFCQTCPYIF